MGLSTRLTLAMVSLVLATVIAVVTLSYRVVEQTILPGETERAQTYAQHLAYQLETYVLSARGDVIGFASAVALRGLMRAVLAGGRDPVDGVSAEEWGSRMASRFKAELEAKPAYIQFRVIGSDGRELVRVDRSGPSDAIRIVPESELSSRAKREYFAEGMKLLPGQIYVSPIELNRESRDVIEMPHIPVIRVVTMLPAPDGRPFGLIVINVDMRPIFDRFRWAAHSHRQIYLVNDEGDYLLHPNPTYEFGFEFGEPVRWQKEFPELASALNISESGTKIVHNAAGDRVGAAVASARLEEGLRIGVIATVPYAELIAPATAVLKWSVIAAAIATLGAIAAAALLARSLSKPLVQMAGAVQAFGNGIPLALPSGGGREMRALSRAFTDMADSMEQKSEQIRRHADLRDRIFESLGDGVLVVDEHGETLFANKELVRLFGDDMRIGSPEWQKTYRRYLPDGVTPYPPEDTPIGRAMRGESFDNLEIIMRNEALKEVRMLANGRPLYDPTGHLMGAVIIYRDITKEWDTAQQLQHAQKIDAIGQLTGGIAHDFNNLLTVITGSTELLADRVRHDRELREMTEMIDEAAERGAGLTRQLLAFARKQHLQPRRIETNKLINDLEKLIRPTLGEAIEIVIRTDPKAWPALADPDQLTTALLNLAINARDAMPKGGKLTIETSNVVLDHAYAETHSEVTPGEYVQIAVSDTGGGIPSELLQKVFEPFFTTKGLGKGTGLGLSMVYGFVKQSGGHIKIYSEEGHGTAIKIYLPRMDATESSREESLKPSGIHRGSETILVVEDDDLVRSNVITLLRDLGYRVVPAANGYEALDLVKKGVSADLLLTDVVMPGMSGSQLVEEILRILPEMKVLFTSGYTENAMIHQGRLEEGVLLLAKPYRKTELARMVRSAIEAVPMTAK
jgi:signal transduction histidine kinase/CheY-like chemotaxis protein